MARIYKKPGPSKNKAKAAHEKKTDKPAGTPPAGGSTLPGGTPPAGGEQAQDGQKNS